MADYVGFKWIAQHLDIRPVQPFAVESKIGSTRRTVVTGQTREETYVAAARPDDTVVAHLAFALKHEIVHLEFLARLFSVMAQHELEEWIRREPSGAYARRAGFLFEWLMASQLGVPDTPSGNYVDALDPDKYVVASRPSNVQRWRVRDNMPGTRTFCPMVLRTEAVRALEGYDCKAALESLEVEFGADIVMRSAVWLSIKESRASFAIEHEEKQVDRVKRFAAVMELRCGQNGDPLALQTLTELQTDILGLATRYGVRRSPVIVGRTRGFTDVVDYIGPHWDDIDALLDGLQAALARTSGAPAILRAGIASFGFVYIHPMADGNGRISRFLINDFLRRDGAVPAPFILPVSATIMNSARERAGYDHALEVLSKPLMRKYQEYYRFGTEYVCPDGVRSNFYFDAYADALPAWRYPDLTHQCEYLGNVVRLTIEDEMSREAGFLRDMDRAREGVKNHLEGPNADIDQIIRSLRENAWKPSNKLLKTFPQLANPALAEAVINAVREALDPATKNAEELDLKLVKHLMSMTQQLAQVPGMSGHRVGTSFAARSLVTAESASEKYEQFLSLLQEPGTRAVLTGAPGSGKSWFLMRAAIDLSGAVSGQRDGTQGRIIPIYTPLRNLTLEMPLLSAVSQYAHMDLTLAEHALRRHRLILFFDGLDELRQEDARVFLRQIDELHAANPKVTSVVSTRPMGELTSAISSDHAFSLADLSLESARDFLCAHLDQRTADKVLRYLDRGHSSIFWSPLMLSPLADVLEEIDERPAADEMILEWFFQSRLSGHDATKAGFRRHTVLETSELRTMISVIALRMKLHGQMSLPREQFEELVKQTASLLALEPNRVKAKLILRDFLALGLLLESATGEISFMHLALQEHIASSSGALVGTDAIAFARLVVDLIRSSGEGGFATKLARGWMRDRSAGGAFLSQLRGTAETESEHTATIIRSVAHSLEVDVDRLEQRNHDLFRLLGARY
jgi:hypothetical protein